MTWILGSGDIGRVSYGIGRRGYDMVRGVLWHCPRAGHHGCGAVRHGSGGGAHWGGGGLALIRGGTTGILCLEHMVPRPAGHWSGWSPPSVVDWGDADQGGGATPSRARPPHRVDWGDADQGGGATGRAAPPYPDHTGSVQVGETAA